MTMITEPNSAKSLIEIVQGLKLNTFKWAKVWTLNGTPENLYPNGASRDHPSAGTISDTVPIGDRRRTIGTETIFSTEQINS